MMKVECNNVDELKMILRELNLISKSFVINGLEATEINILLQELRSTIIRGKEHIVRDGYLYDVALEKIKNIDEELKHNNELQESYIMASLMTPVRKIQEPFYTKAEFDKLAQNIKNIQEIYKVDTKIKYELEFKEDKVGSYYIYFGDNNGAHINIFKPNRIYKNTRLVKALIEDSESYIENFNFDKDYIIIRNDNMNKFVIFTRNDKHTDEFNYIAPEEYCKDADRI